MAGKKRGRKKGSKGIGSTKIFGMSALTVAALGVGGYFLYKYTRPGSEPAPAVGKTR